MLYIGIDLGTSAVKLLLMDEAGTIHKVVSREYPLEFPKPGWSQQNLQDWKTAVLTGLLELTAECDKTQIADIGCGGQMHGLVILDENDEVIRPAILWNDGRTAPQVDYLNNVIGKDKLSAYTGNIAFAGFTAPKILWVQENEPENFARIAKIMLPKDYINSILTGVHCCDYSDASGMLLLDVEHKCWSKEMLEICGVSESQMPKLFESYEVVGTLKPEISALEYIAENTYQYFVAQNTDTTYTKSLQKALKETEQAISNLLRAIEAGIFNESTKDRMNELEEQKSELRLALAAAKLKEDLGLKKEHIIYFLHRFADMDYSDLDCQKRLIKTFLNSVFVYDDKVVLTFNYSGDGRTMTLHEIDGGLGHSIRIPSAVVHQKKKQRRMHLLLF